MTAARDVIALERHFDAAGQGVKDLISILAIPAAAAGQPPGEIGATLIDVLIATLRLDFACARIADPAGAGPLELVRLSQHGASAVEEDMLRGMAGLWLTSDHFDTPRVVPNPRTGARVVVMRSRLGLEGELGAVVLGSRRLDFPTDLERVLARVGSNQATIALHEAGRWQEQRRLEKELERRVQERTAQLSVANEELRQHIRDRKRAERALRRVRERTIRDRFEAVIEERTRLAREMHDTLLQGFTGVCLRLVALAGRSTDAPGRNDALREVIALAHQTLTDARQAVWGLRAPRLRSDDLGHRIEQEARDLIGPASVALDFAIAGERRPLRTHVEDELCRLSGEAVANALRHGNPSRIIVSLVYESVPRMLRLIIRDDGSGFVIHPAGDAPGAAGGEHFGLLGMRERAHRIGADLQITSGPGAGTTVLVVLPLSSS
jgi:signal transduction histidine kinase